MDENATSFPVDDLTEALATGVHGLVTVRIRHLPRSHLEIYYNAKYEAGVYRVYEEHLGVKARADGVEILYRGHKEDLAVLGCILFAGRYDWMHKDGQGGLWSITSKAGPGHRGIIEVHYLTANRAFAANLPGMRERFPQVLSRMAGRPHLRLVVNHDRPSRGDL